MVGYQQQQQQQQRENTVKEELPEYDLDHIRNVQNRFLYGFLRNQMMGMVFAAGVANPYMEVGRWKPNVEEEEE